MATDCRKKEPKVTKSIKKIVLKVRNVCRKSSESDKSVQIKSTEN